MNICLSSLTSREFQSRLKSGYSVDDFCVMYSCTHDELNAFIERVYSQQRKRDEIARKLRGNAKQKGNKSQAATPAKTTRSALAAAKAGHVPTKSKPDESTPKVEATPEPETEVLEVATSEPAQPEPTELEVLQAREESLSAEVYQIEVEHKDAWTAHNAVAGTIRGISDRVEQLKVELGQLVDKYEVELTKAREYEAVMSERSEAWKVKHAELEQVRTRITELTAIKAYVYESGEIEAEGDHEMSFDGSDNIYAQLLEDNSEFLEDLRKRDLRVLAKLLALSQREQRYEFAFDNPAVEAAFFALCKK